MDDYELPIDEPILPAEPTGDDPFSGLSDAAEAIGDWAVMVLYSQIATVALLIYVAIILTVVAMRMKR